jgi:hypothetical protein
MLKEAAPALAWVATWFSPATGDAPKVVLLWAHRRFGGGRCLAINAMSLDPAFGQLWCELISVMSVGRPRVCLPLNQAKSQIY